MDTDSFLGEVFFGDIPLLVLDTSMTRYKIDLLNLLSDSFDRFTRLLHGDQLGNILYLLSGFFDRFTCLLLF